MEVLNAFNGVFTIFTLFLVGVLMSHKGVLTPERYNFCSSMLINYAIPVMLFQNALKNINLPYLREMGLLLLVPFVIQLGAYLLARLCARLFRIAPGKRGVFVSMFSMSNTILLGLPICTAIFGESCVPFVTAFYLANTSCFWLLSVPMIAQDGTGQAPGMADRLRRTFSPPVIGFLIGSAMGLFGLRLPVFLASAATYLGNITTPVSALMVGCLFYGMGKDALHTCREVRWALLGRCLICPALALGVCLLFKVPALAAGVFCAEAAMPVMNQCVLMASFYKADDKACAQGMALSLLLSMAVIPGLIFILGQLYQ